MYIYIHVYMLEHIRISKRQESINTYILLEMDIMHIYVYGSEIDYMI
jgi:hypothetical protein